MHSKKRFSITILFILFTLLVTACGNNTETSGEPPKSSGDQNSEKEVVLELATWMPSGHPVTTEVYEAWKTYVEDKTEGSVKVNLTFNGILGSSGTQYNDVSSGVYDILAFSIPAYNRDTPWVQFTIGDLPLAFASNEEAVKVMNKFGEKYGQAAYGDEFKYFNNAATCSDPYRIYSTSKIENFNDLKGKKFRVTGTTLAPMIESWGAAPTSIPSDEQYEALDKGTLDGAIYISDLEANMYEVIDYVVELSRGINVVCGASVMDMDKYESLPDDVQQLLEDDLMPKLAELYNNNYIKATANAEKMFEENFEVVPFSAEEEAKIFETAEIVWENWAKELNDKGYDGDQMMADFKTIMKEEGLNPPL